MAEEDKMSEIRFLKEFVDELYKYRDCYFETHSVEEAGRKQQDVSQELGKVLKKLEEKEECYRHNAEFLLQKGRCLNVAPDFSAAAEDCLSRAVKLEPGLVEAWNTLGEQYWKKGDLTAAKNCFTGALQQSKNKVSLRNMSMVLRQLPATDGDAHGKQVLESVDMARQAVQLDVTDGTSWYILGNAYVSLFFSCGQKPQLSTQALSAYAQSERVDRAAACYPELHFNRATLFQYEEMFGSALSGYSRAAALDPGWPEPAEKEKLLMEYLDNVTDLCQKKGKVKARRLRTMLSDLSASSSLGPCSSPEFRSWTGRVGALEPRPSSSLSHGLNSGVAARGKVVFSLASRGRMAFTFGMVDGEETCVAVMVYNTADSWGVLIGDTVVIPEPQVKWHSVTHKDTSFDFKSIRVDSPLFLVVNGRTQNAQSVIVTSVSYKPQSE
ncbi:tetratricopeptide repeat protein 5 isoform X1 [Corythoichthys intestinalis]|uniref:tetratricopeptide repeat protein 5 isoform X1 n=1 Tax=Corythoichthys intestinalis TaxID=161448 RepID=UPI0025A55C86|nr:tetratricopeptide repeat protein 5 isoform X1 [Corythoichthys intestinalis]XP_061810528.1 tetratricopeptide repeat protein 5-like [Nerophis lumbriciformis]